MIRVLIAENQPVYRDGLQSAIEGRSGMALAGAEEDGEAALQAVREARPDVLVMDPSLPGLDGLTVIRSLVSEKLPTRVLVVSEDDDRAAIYDAIAAGARGYLFKDEEADAICDAIARIAAGETVWRGHTQDAIARELTNRDNRDGHRSLSPREIEILKLIADGKSTSEVAEQLYLSVATIKTHLHRTYTKLEVNDRAAAVAEALRRGLIE